MPEMPPFVVYGLYAVLAILLGPKAFTFLRAITGGWNKDNIPARMKICKVCPRVREKVTVDHDGNSHSYLFCDECKCGSHHLAELSVKLGFNNLKCAMDPPKWGKKEAMTVHEAHDVLTGRMRKEAAIDQAERANLMAGRPRDAAPIANNGRRPASGVLAQPNPKGRGGAVPAGRGVTNAPDGPDPLGQPFTNAPDQISVAVVEENFQKLNDAPKARQPSRTARALELKRQSQELQQRRTARATAKTKEEAALAGVDHADDIHVDQSRESDDG